MGHTFSRRRSSALLPASLSASVLFAASIASAGIHTWDVREVFSNASGTIQYVELIERQLTGGAEINVGTSSLTSAAKSHSWTNGQVAPPTATRSYLIASASFAALPNAPTPDVIIPVGKMPFFNPAGDTITFAGGIDAWTFGAVPTNGINSLDRDTGVGVNTPKNYANTQFTGVNAAPPPVPTASFWTTAALCASLAAIAMVALRRFRAGEQS